MEEEEKEIYSHSRLWLFENCPEAYKVKYIDKEFPEMPVSISLFLGDFVHQSLEWLYNEVKEGRKVEMDELIRHFVENWHNNLTEIRTLDGTKPEDHFNKGVKYLVDYYRKNFPFKDNTIAIEKKILFPLNEKYWIQGFIDRIVKTGENEYEVHDYKTNQYMKTQKQVDEDRQLAFYHLGLKNIFGEDIKVKLIWHFLAHNDSISSKRDEEQLSVLKEETIKIIEKIHNTKEWNACGKHWCDWCNWKKNNNFEEYIQRKRRAGNESLNSFM